MRRVLVTAALGQVGRESARVRWATRFVASMVLVQALAISPPRAWADPLSSTVTVDFPLPKRPPCPAFARARIVYDDLPAGAAIRVLLEPFSPVIELTEAATVAVPPGPAPSSVRMHLSTPALARLHRIDVSLGCPAAAAEVTLSWTAGGAAHTEAFYPTSARRPSEGEMAGRWGCAGECRPGHDRVAALYADALAEVKRRHAVLGILDGPSPPLVRRCAALAQALATDAVQLISDACVEERCTGRADETRGRLASVAGAAPHVARVVADSSHLGYGFTVGDQSYEVACTATSEPTCKLTVFANGSFRGATFVSRRFRGEGEMLSIGRTGLLGFEGQVGFKDERFVVSGVALR